MEKWEVVTVIIALASLISLFAGASWKLATALQKNTDATQNQTNALNQFRSDNDKDHEKFSDKLEDHESRISVLEHSE